MQLMDAYAPIAAVMLGGLVAATEPIGEHLNRCTPAVEAEWLCCKSCSLSNPSVGDHVASACGIWDVAVWSNVLWHRSACYKPRGHTAGIPDDACCRCCNPRFRCAGPSCQSQHVSGHRCNIQHHLQCHWPYKGAVQHLAVHIVQTLALLVVTSFKRLLQAVGCFVMQTIIILTGGVLIFGETMPWWEPNLMRWAVMLELIDLCGQSSFIILTPVAPFSCARSLLCFHRDFLCMV